MARRAKIKREGQKRSDAQRALKIEFMFDATSNGGCDRYLHFHASDTLGARSPERFTAMARTGKTRLTDPTEK